MLKTASFKAGYLQLFTPSKNNGETKNGSQVETGDNNMHHLQMGLWETYYFILDQKMNLKNPVFLKKMVHFPASHIDWP